MIDPKAIIDPSAKLADDVSVGPYAIIGAGVEIGEGSSVGSHTIIEGPTRIGRNNKIYSFASIGCEPQDKKYSGEATTLEIGDGNTIREYVTISRGTVQDNGVTRVGDDNWIMAYVHIAHDCIVGNHTIFANCASLAGHVVVEDHVILGGFTVVHQFCKIGRNCITAMGTIIFKDVLPYIMVSGNRAEANGLNIEGLKRHGFSSDTLAQLRKAYKIIYRSGNTLEQAIEQLTPLAQDCPEIDNMLTFIRSVSRGIVR